MVSYSFDQAVEKLAPVGNPYADEIGERPNPYLNRDEGDD